VRKRECVKLRSAERVKTMKDEEATSQGANQMMVGFSN
jgi:hypothetical protein